MEKVKNKGGRPPGSKTKNRTGAKDILSRNGLSGIENICRVAAGKPVYRQLKGGGRETLYPELNDIMKASEQIMKRLVPELKATEVIAQVEHSGEISHPEYDARQLSRAILSAIGGPLIEAEAEEIAANPVLLEEAE